MADTLQAVKSSFAGVSTSVRDEVDITWTIENFQMVVHSDAIYVLQVLEGGGHIYVNALTHYCTFPVGSSDGKEKEKILLKFQLTVEKDEADVYEDKINLTVSLLNRNSLSSHVLVIFDYLKIMVEDKTVQCIADESMISLTILPERGWADIINMSQIDKFLDSKGSLTFQMKILHFQPPCLSLELQKIETGPALTFDQLQEDLENLFGDEMVCDVEIKVTEKSSKSFFAHKEILAARSTVFCAMFFNKSETRESLTGVVEVSDISVKTMDLLLNFIYTGHFKDNSILMEMISELLSAADKYDVKTLKDICVENIIRNLSPRNAMQLYSVCKRHGLHTTMPRILKYIGVNARWFT